MENQLQLRKCEQWYLASLRGFRQGLNYGFKVRFTHSLVMAILFKQGNLQEKIKFILKLSMEHSLKLGTYVFSYKTILALLEYIFKQKNPRNSLIAGFLSSIVFTGDSGVNRQMTFYLFSRIFIGILKHLKNTQKIPEFKNVQGFKIMTMISWALAMYLFEKDSSCLEPSLQGTMEFLYRQSDFMTSWKDFVPFLIPDLAK